MKTDLAPGQTIAFRALIGAEARGVAAPPSAHPHIDELAQAVLFESQAKFDRMQAFLDRRKK